MTGFVLIYFAEMGSLIVIGIPLFLMTFGRLFFVTLCFPRLLLVRF